MNTTQENPVNLGETQAIRDERGRYLKGVSGHPSGPRAGYKQKSSLIKEAFCEVFAELGGAGALLKWVKKNSQNERDFYKLILGVMPKEVSLDGEGFGETKIIIVRTDGVQAQAIPR